MHYSSSVSKEIEKAILDYSLEHPSDGCLKVSQQLALKGVNVSSGGVRGVWISNKLESHAPLRRRDLRLS